MSKFDSMLDDVLDMSKPVFTEPVDDRSYCEAVMDECVDSLVTEGFFSRNAAKSSRTASASEIGVELARQAGGRLKDKVERDTEFGRKHAEARTRREAEAAHRMAMYQNEAIANEVYKKRAKAEKKAAKEAKKDTKARAAEVKRLERILAAKESEARQIKDKINGCKITIEDKKKEKPNAKYANDKEIMDKINASTRRIIFNLEEDISEYEKKLNVVNDQIADIKDRIADLK